MAPPWNFPVRHPRRRRAAPRSPPATPSILKPAPQTPRCAEASSPRRAGRRACPPTCCSSCARPDDDVGRRLDHPPRRRRGGAHRLVRDARRCSARGSRDAAPARRDERQERHRRHRRTPTSTSPSPTSCARRSGTPDRSARRRASASSSASVVRRRALPRQLADAARSLRVGPTPPIRRRRSDRSIRAAERARSSARSRRSTRASRGCVEPRRSTTAAGCGRPGIKDGVLPGSWFHHTECFGPVLGLMRADDLDDAIAAAERHRRSGSPAASTPSTRTRSSAGWTASRSATPTSTGTSPGPSCGASRSAGGSARASAAAPRPAVSTTCSQLGTWRSERLPADAGDPLAVAAVSDDHWWRTHYGIEHDPSALFCESNVLRYRPRPHVADPPEPRRPLRGRGPGGRRGEPGRRHARGVTGEHRVR